MKLEIFAILLIFSEILMFAFFAKEGEHFLAIIFGGFAIFGTIIILGSKKERF